MRSTSTDCPSGKEWSLPNKELAVNTAILLTILHGDPVYPYPCPSCRDWHVSRKKPSRSTLDEKDWTRLLGADASE